VFLGELPDFRYRIHRANFVVGVHDRDQDRRRPDRLTHILRIHTAILANRQVRDFETVLLQILAGIQHSLVLDRLGNDVVALFAVHFRDALDHQVVGFGRSAGENNFLRGRANQRSHLLARILNRFFASPAERVVAARRIPEFLREIRQHRLQHPRVHRGGGVIVHVNWQLDGHFRVLL
jgi:hypothetical protein